MAKPVKNNHKKPTKEELKAEGERILEEAEELEPEGDEDTSKGRDDIPEEEQETVEQKNERQKAEAEEELKDESPEVETTPDEEGETEEEPSDKEQAEPSKEKFKRQVKEKTEKLSDSAREVQKIHAKNRVMNEALVRADDLPDPTEEELEKEYPDWDVMSDIEKTLAKETVVSRNWRKIISEGKNQATKIEKWVESVKEFIDDPKTLTENPELEGKTEDFESFALSETNNSIPFSILVSAFLHRRSKDVVPNKGRMFEKGSGGPNSKPKLKDGKISLEDARTLRETDYTKWKKLLQAGKIDNDI